jgi:hypothetical protein
MKIEITVPDGVSGNCEVQTFIVPENDLSQQFSLLSSGRGVPAGTYKKLIIDGECVMSNTPDEIRDFRKFVYEARGSVLINGLGLGVLLKALIEKTEITDITVIEKSADVIKLVAPTYLIDKRITIINEDAFTYSPPKNKKYDTVWHDIWNYICADNLKEMEKLHRKYGRKTKYQESWCKDLCKRLKDDN